MTQFRRQWPWWRRALVALSALALVLSSYLGWHYLAGESMIGCSGANSCDQILNGRWSTIGGVLPVSGLAVGTYLAVLIASFCIGPATVATVQRLAWRALLVLAGAIAGSAVWFSVVQKWVIGSFCPYCMTTHIVGLLLAALVFWQAPRQFNSNRSRPRVIGALPAMGVTMAGVALAGALAICQIAITPAAVYREGELRSNPRANTLEAVPLVGPPKAAYVVTLLFDYKCPHCQKLHFLLAEVIRRYHGKLAFVLSPAPLNRQCNPYITRDLDEFKDSCELAKIGLAVWVASPKAFPVFDQWMFSLESGDLWHSRTLDATRAKAIELVGQSKFDAALANPWVDRYLQSSIQIYGDTGGTAVPKLVFGSRWVTPEPHDADDLISILHDSLAVPNP